jgi:hypothetical protein
VEIATPRSGKVEANARFFIQSHFVSQVRHRFLQPQRKAETPVLQEDLALLQLLYRLGETVE